MIDRMERPIPSAAAAAPSRARRRRPLAALITTAALALSPGPPSSVSAQSAGLRGPSQLIELQQLEVPASSGGFGGGVDVLDQLAARRLPQHGNQRPRRPDEPRRRIPPQYLPPGELPPGHDGHRRLPDVHRRLLEEASSQTNNVDGAPSRALSGADAALLHRDGRGEMPLPVPREEVEPEGRELDERGDRELHRYHPLRRGRGDRKNNAREIKGRQNNKDEREKRQAGNKKNKKVKKMQQLMAHHKVADLNMKQKHQKLKKFMNHGPSNGRPGGSRPNSRPGMKKQKRPGPGSRPGNKPGGRPSQRPGNKKKSRSSKSQKTKSSKSSAKSSKSSAKSSKSKDMRPNNANKPGGKKPGKRPGKKPGKKPGNYMDVEIRPQSSPANPKPKPNNNEGGGKDKPDKPKPQSSSAGGGGKDKPKPQSQFPIPSNAEVIGTTEGGQVVYAVKPSKEKDSVDEDDMVQNYVSAKPPKPPRTPRPNRQPAPEPASTGDDMGLVSSPTLGDSMGDNQGQVYVSVKPPKPPRTPRPNKQPTPKPKPAPAANEMTYMSVKPPEPEPTPRPSRGPRTPRPNKQPVPEPTEEDGQYAAGMTYVTVKPPKPAPTPRPTRGPKPAPVDIGDASFMNADAGASVGKWNFVSSLPDPSTQLDSFEAGTDLDWVQGDIPWERSSVMASEGHSSMMSRINMETYNQGSGMPTYSTHTLRTNSDFEGGILTFQVLARSLALPSEAFYVEVDGNVELLPEVAAHRSAQNSGWVEYSVVVGKGEREVSFVHVHNPFSLQSLPDPGNEVGLWMDDLRFAPLHSDRDLSELSLRTGGGAEWKLKNDDEEVAAYSSELGNGGYADIEFVLYSPNGGLLEYRVRTDTTAPNDDFAILFDGEIADALFGEMIDYEPHAVEVPRGKVVVTLRHRKNPGNMNLNLLDGLGGVGTAGETWLEDLTFLAD